MRIDRRRQCNDTTNPTKIADTNPTVGKLCATALKSATTRQPKAINRRSSVHALRALTSDATARKRHIRTKLSTAAP